MLELLPLADAIAIPTDQLPLWLVAASLALNALFLSRLLRKIDKSYELARQVHDAVLGTTLQRGLADRVAALETHTGLADAPPEDPPRDGRERRRGERRRRDDVS